MWAVNLTGNFAVFLPWNSFEPSKIFRNFFFITVKLRKKKEPVFMHINRWILPFLYGKLPQKFYDHEFTKQKVTKKNYVTHITPKYLENIVKIFLGSNVRLPQKFWYLSLISSKYCNNLAMSAQNMTYAIFSKYCQN